MLYDSLTLFLSQFTHALSEKYDSTDDFAYYWDRCVADGFQAKGCFNANSYSFFAVGEWRSQHLSIWIIR